MCGSGKFAILYVLFHEEPKNHAATLTSHHDLFFSLPVGKSRLVITVRHQVPRMSLYWHSCTFSTVRPEGYQGWTFQTSVTKIQPCKFTSTLHKSDQPLVFRDITIPLFTADHIQIIALPSTLKMNPLALERGCFTVLAQARESKCVNRKEKL